MSDVVSHVPVIDVVADVRGNGFDNSLIRIVFAVFFADLIGTGLEDQVGITKTQIGCCVGQRLAFFEAGFFFAEVLGLATDFFLTGAFLDLGLFDLTDEVSLQ